MNISVIMINYLEQEDVNSPRKSSGVFIKGRRHFDVKVNVEDLQYHPDNVKSKCSQENP